MEFVLYRAGKIMRRIPLTGRSLSIGRDAANDIVLQDPSVAPVHLRLHCRDGRYTVVNCDRVTGIEVNHRPVNQAVLGPADRCQVGEFEISVDPGGSETAAAQPVPDRPAAAPIAPPSHPGAADRPDPSGDLLALLRVTSLFTRPDDRKMLLERMMDCLIQVFGAERCSLLLPDSAGAFRPAVTRNLDAGTIERGISQTVLGKVLKTGAAVIERDALRDAELSQANSIALSRVRSVICSPLLRDDKIVGVLYLDSPAKGPAVEQAMLDRLEVFSVHALAALDSLEEKEGLKLRAGQLQQMAQDAVREVHPATAMIAEDPVSREIVATIARVAASQVSTLLTGESGTGKELVARSIHAGSGRKAGPFIAVNCGSLPAELVESELFGHEKGAFSGAVAARIGKFELAQGGTLFLDEIGELPLAAQVKLLRALQERVIDRVGGRQPIPIDIRLIAATNVELAAKVQAREFREDLLFRINVFHIPLPPLRQRQGDIETLALFFIAEFNRKLGRRIAGLTAGARKALLGYRWPGNVRELRNVIERAFVLEDSEEITERSLPFANLADLAPASDVLPAPGEGPLSSAVAAYERSFIEAALKRHGHNITAAARSLRVSRQTLYTKMEELGLRTRTETL